MHNDRAEQTAGGGTKSAVGTQRTPRSVPRYRFVATAVVTELSSGTRLPARTSELSINGCYIDTLNPFPDAALVRLRIIKDDRVFETPGRVLYCHPGFGMGIVFIDSTPDQRSDRKSTRLNSSHGSISYAVFCLKKKRDILI